MTFVEYYADWDVSSADILETVLVDLDEDCEAIVIDVWCHNHPRWWGKRLPKLGLTVDAHSGLLDMVLMDRSVDQ